MYTATEAREKINSETFKFEKYLDEFLYENFRGGELCVSVNTFTESIIWGVLDKYKDNGWNVRPQNINPGPGTGSVYFSLPGQEDHG
jgi:hypothetical protein